MSERSGVLGMLKTAKRVALSGDYDRDVSPNDYERYVENSGHRSIEAEALANLMLSRLPVNRDLDQGRPSILDVAAGTGIISRAMSSKGYTVTATDLSQKALDFLHEQSPEIITQKADMNGELPFKDNTFEGVTSVWANRYIRDTDAFLKEVHRVLKPGGIFIWPIYPSERPFWKLRNGLGQHTTARSLMRDARDIGFGEVEVIKMSMLEARSLHIPLHSIPQYIIAKR